MEENPQKISAQTELGCGLQKFLKFQKTSGFNLNEFFFIFPIFFGIFDEGKVWVTSTFRQESTVKISAKTDNRAKSYARFTEGGSESVFQKPESVRGRVWNRVRFFF